jgi:hypothetical protein
MRRQLQLQRWMHLVARWAILAVVAPLLPAHPWKLHIIIAGIHKKSIQQSWQ